MVTGPVTEMLERNIKFAQNYKAPPSLLQVRPQLQASKNGVLVISCSDARLDIDKILGLDASLRAVHIKNAGGRVFDAIRSLVVLQTIGAPGTIVVVHHTDCGMTHFHNKEVHEALLEIAPDQKDAIEKFEVGGIESSIEESVKEDVEMLKASPFIKKDTQIVGLKYDIWTGVLTVVE